MKSIRARGFEGLEGEERFGYFSISQGCVKSGESLFFRDVVVLLDGEKDPL